MACNGKLGASQSSRPTSQIVGTQAVYNVLSGERYKTITNEVKRFPDLDREFLQQRAAGVRTALRVKKLEDSMPDIVVMFFVLGLVAGLLRSDLAIPKAAYDTLSLLLMLSGQRDRRHLRFTTPRPWAGNSGTGAARAELRSPPVAPRVSSRGCRALVRVKG